MFSIAVALYSTDFMNHPVRKGCAKITRTWIYLIEYTELFICNLLQDEVRILDDIDKELFIDTVKISSVTWAGI